MIFLVLSDLNDLNDLKHFWRCFSQLVNAQRQKVAAVNYETMAIN